MKSVIKKKYLAPSFLGSVFFGSRTRKRLSENFISLSLLQAVNYILPLLTLPYLVRVLGPAQFGLIAFAQAFINYFVIFTDYGFNLSATKNIAVCRDNKEQVDRIFSSVMATKAILGAASFFVLGFILFLVPRFGHDGLVYIYTFGLVLGNILFPVWFFQGVEKMKYITLLNIAARLFFTILIFVFVRSAPDYVYVPLINSAGSVAAGILSLWLIAKNFKINFHFPRIKDIAAQLIEGWYVFISMAAVSLYTTSNAFILGLFTNNTIVGYYSAAEKLIQAATGLLNPISQTIYPHMSNMAANSKEAAIIFIKKITKLVGAGEFVFSLLIFIFAPLVVHIILGSNYQPSVNVLRILSFLPFVIGLSNLFGIQIMLPFGFKKAFFKIIITAGVVNIALILSLIPLLNQNGVALAWVITETFITISMFFYLDKKGIKILGM